MSDTPKLKPRTVTLGSEAKFFGLDKGESNGSSASITFEIPDGMTDADLKRAMLLEKERLDIFTLITERLKGSLSQELFEARRANIKNGYDKVLKRNKPEETAE